MIKLISKCALLSVLALSLSAFSMDDSSTYEQERMDRESRIEQDTKEKMAEVDANADGVIDKKEFAAQINKENPDAPLSDEDLDFFFAQFDTDKNGLITEVEMALMMARLSKNSCVNCD
jgi:Ca2+-binding EF-hand superfamily protein